jgi:uncharacterized protein (DUF885 family)
MQYFLFAAKYEDDMLQRKKSPSLISIALRPVLTGRLISHVGVKITPRRKEPKIMTSSTNCKFIFPFLFLAAVFSLASCRPNNPTGNLAALTKQYLDGLFQAKPHLATFMGDHRFDDRLADLSAGAIQKRIQQLEQQKSSLDSLLKEQLNLDDQIDASILSDGMNLESLYLREIKEWQWDPRLHDSFPYYDPREILASRISDILHGDFAPEAERLHSLTGQMKGMPAFLRHAEGQLKNPAKIYTQQAIEDNKGRLILFKEEVYPFISQPSLPAATRQEAQSAYRDAFAALEEFQKFLEQELLPRSTGDWRLGSDLYHKKFPLALQTSLTPEAVVPSAELAFKVAKAELFQAAQELYGELFPGKKLPPLSSDPILQSRILNEVKAELSKDHPKAADLVEAHRRNLSDFRKFIEEHHLLQLPSLDTLVVKEMPPFKRGVSAAEYLAPGVLEKRDKWQSTYYVDPIDPSWSKDRVESYLQGSNNYEVQLTAMHEAYPGHHTQYSYSKHSLNALRAVLWNAPFVEGWAVYGENLMTKLGYGGDKNLRYHFFARRGDMIVATNTIIDIKLHTGQMTEAEAVRFMVEQGLQEQAQAEKKLRRAQLDTTQLCQYFLGYDEILALERDYRLQNKAAFSQQKFDEELIGHGSIAVRYLRKYLLK